MKSKLELIQFKDKFNRERIPISTFLKYVNSIGRQKLGTPFAKWYLHLLPGWCDEALTNCIPDRAFSNTIPGIAEIGRETSNKQYCITFRIKEPQFDQYKTGGRLTELVLPVRKYGEFWFIGAKQ